MRSALAAIVCVVALLAGCASEPPAPAPKDSKFQREANYLNAKADGCMKDAEMLREQAHALIGKAEEKELEAKDLRNKARDAANGKLVTPPEPEPDNH